jgi:hypothetical protein
MQLWTTYNLIGYGLMKIKLVPICAPLKTSIIITSLVGGYMTYIYPRRFVFRLGEIKYELSHYSLMLLDFIIHQIPLIDMIFLNNPNTSQICGRHMFYPMIFWKMINQRFVKNPEKIYGISLNKLMFSSISIFLGLSLLKHHSFLPKYCLRNNK